MNTASLFSTVVDVCQRYIHHHYMFPIWNPLWRSIQDPHVSSLHMSTPKKETRLPLQSIAKTETRCNTHTGSSLLMATVCVFEWQRRTCTRTKVTFTVPSAFKHKYVANMWKDVTEHVTEGSLMLSLHFPWHCVLVWYLKCESVLRSRNEYKHCERKH